MFSTLIRFSLPALVFGLVACSASNDIDDDVLAINPLTGEQKEFPDSQSVPDGWTVCESGVCPTLVDCDGLDEAQCLARVDCQPYFIGAWPQECEGQDPPSYCSKLPYGGCGPISGGGTEPPGGGGGSVPPGTGGSGGGVGGGCGLQPGCEMMCPPGYTHPIDDQGCEHTCECVPEPTCDCGPQPQIAMICDDGSTADMICEENDQGVCGWTFRCTTCEPVDCGPMPMIAMICDDGSTANTVCEPSPGSAGSGCGWAFKCP